MLPRKPVSPPLDTPSAMRAGAESALAFERIAGEFPLGTCIACWETRLNVTYRKGRCGGEICLRRSADKQWIYTEENNALPIWRGADGETHYDAPAALADLTLSEKLLIARLSATVAIHRLAHGGVASPGHVATSPKPVDPMAAALPRLPSDVAIIRVRRGGGWSI